MITSVGLPLEAETGRGVSDFWAFAGYLEQHFLSQKLNDYHV